MIKFGLGLALGVLGMYLWCRYGQAAKAAIDNRNRIVGATQIISGAQKVFEGVL